MRDQQGDCLLDQIAGKPGGAPPVGFIINSPWLPGWAEISTLDYFTSDECWFQANLKAVETFPEVLFLPGFWAEFGICTEPSAFGAKCSFPENELPPATAECLVRSPPRTSGSLSKRSANPAFSNQRQHDKRGRHQS